MAAPNQYSLIVYVTVPFRGGTQLTSNRYFFKKSDGTTAEPSWDGLRTAVVNAQKAIYKSNVHITAVKGTAPGSDVAVYEWAGSVAGTNGVSNDDAAGELCALIRYFTAARSAKNHPIYLYNYMHGQTVDSANKQLIGGSYGPTDTFAGDWITGFSDGTDSFVRCGPHGAAAVSKVVDQYLRVHTFPHRAFRA